MSEVVLSSCQSKALLGLTRWYNGSVSNAILQGEAGSGKTFLIEQFITSLGNRVKPLLLAETHEAVRVLAKSTNYKYDVNTICSALNLVLTPDQDKLVLKQRAIPELEYNLLIVDEASQLDDFKIEKLQETGKYILFVGHKSQLPPVDVNQSIVEVLESPIFKKGYPEFLLETQQRHKGELYKFCQDVEKIIYSATVPEPKFGIELPDVLEMIQHEEVKDKIIKGQFVALAYTNERVVELNDLIRRSLFGTIADDEPFIKDDNIICRRPTYLFKKPIRENTATIAGLRLGSARNNTEKGEEYDSTKLELLPTNSRCKVLLVKQKLVMRVTSAEIKVKVKVGLDRVKTGYIYCPLDTMEFDKVLLAIKYSAFNAIGNAATVKWREYHDFQNVLSVIRPSYALTVHCSQGSTIDTVIVDDADINKCPNISLRKKLRYVAYSRAKHKLYRLLKDHGQNIQF